MRERPDVPAHPAAEPCNVPPPVDRISYLERLVRGRVVLDLGCLDSTAESKPGSGMWLHERLGRSARALVGLDKSTRIPPAGIDTGYSTIVLGDVMALGDDLAAPDVIVAGELIEHLECPVNFLAGVKARFPGALLALTTPNATGLTNVLLAVARRESMHPDHLMVFSHKSLRQALERAGIHDFDLIPYRVTYAEARLAGGVVRRVLIGIVEAVVHAIERLVPLWSNGWIVVARL